MEQDDSLEIIIQEPYEKRQKATAVISSWQFDITNDNARELRFYFCANEIYIQNLIKGRETPSLNEDQRKKFHSGTIIIQPFLSYIKEHNGRDEESIQCEGEISFIYQQYKGLRLNLKMNRPSIFGSNDYIAARFILNQGQGEDAKSKTLRLQHLEQIWTCHIEEFDLQKFIKNRLAIEFILQKQTVFQDKFSGIKNDGNTCYMNSILQVLYFIKILRENIIKYDGNGKVIKAMKEVILDLMDGPSTRQGAVNAEQLIEAFGRFAEYPRRQQDTQEFLLGFLQKLEQENPTFAQLWQGQSIQVLQSTEQDKPYTSRVKQDFSGLDLQLQDQRGNTFKNLVQAITHLLDKQRVEDKIETEQYGKITIQKRRQFNKLPPVLFMTLKRYKYKRGSNKPVKVLADLQYPENIDLGFLLGTATGEDMNYILFAVTVHKGQTHSSGHYYSFVNTSDDCSQPYWVRFDDSRVTLSSRDQAVSFSGGKKKNITWDKQYEKFREKQFVLEDTAYVLVYMKIDFFRQYQKIKVQIPKIWITEKRKTKVRQQIKEQTDLMQVQVFVSDLQPNFDPFGKLQTFPIPLRPKQDIVTQLCNKKNMDILSCRVGKVWKVFKDDGKLKQLHQYADIPQTPQTVFGYKRGHKIPDYLLVLPANIPIYQKLQSMKAIKSNGLVKVTVLNEQEQEKIEWRLIDKDFFNDFINEEEKKYEKKASVQNEDLFLNNWNDFSSMLLD